MIGILALLAKNKRDSYLFITVDGILRHKGFSKYRKSGKAYGRAMVERCLSEFRELGILSSVEEVVIEPGIRDGKSYTLDIKRKVRFFNPHDTMTRQYKNHCVFIGPGKTPGVWRGNVWQADNEGLVGGLIVDEGVCEGDGESRREIKGEGRCTGKRESKGDPLPGYVREFPDLVSNQGDSRPEKSAIAFLTFESSESVKPIEPGKTDEPTEPTEIGVKIGSYENAEGTGKGEGQVKGDPSFSLSLSSHSLTHEKRTVRQHFENCEDAVLLATDGLVPRPIKSDSRWIDLKVVQHDSLHRAIYRAAEELGDLALVDRRTLATVMNRAIAIYNGDPLHREKAPKQFFKLMKDFQEQGGEVTQIPKPKPPLEKWSEAWLQSQGVFSYREAWQKYKDEANAELLNDWYERDATDDKPPAPWRNTVVTTHGGEGDTNG